MEVSVHFNISIFCRCICTTDGLKNVTFMTLESNFKNLVISLRYNLMEPRSIEIEKGFLYTNTTIFDNVNTL